MIPLILVCLFASLASSKPHCPTKTPELTVLMPNVRLQDYPIHNGTAGLFIPLTESNVRFYYFEHLSREMQLREKRQAMKRALESIVLISQFYLADLPEKREEMLASLQVNLLSPFVYRIYLLQEDSTLNSMITKNLAVPPNKLHFTVLGERLSMKHGVDFANTEIQREMVRIKRKLIVAVSNIDDLFVSPTIMNIMDILDSRWHNTLFFVSRARTFRADPGRFEKSAFLTDHHLCFDRKRGLSSDTFVFVPPLAYKGTGADLDLKLGTNDMEIRIGQQILIHMPGWGVTNLCAVWEMYHNHRYRTDRTGKVIDLESKAIRGYVGLATPLHNVPRPVRQTNQTLACMNNRV